LWRNGRGQKIVKAREPMDALTSALLHPPLTHRKRLLDPALLPDEAPPQIGFACRHSPSRTIGRTVEGKEKFGVVLEDDVRCRTGGLRGALTSGEWDLVALGSWLLRSRMKWKDRLIYVVGRTSPVELVPLSGPRHHRHALPTPSPHTRTP
jgi:hypothetical protein